MKRISIDDFDGGINDIDDATLIPNNACVEIKNYEYRDLDGMKRRFGIDNNILNDAKIEDIKSFDIWYPNNLLSDMYDDKIFVLHKKIADTILIPTDPMDYTPQAYFNFSGSELTEFYPTGVQEDLPEVTEVSIPPIDTTTGNLIETIGDNAFADKTNITSVIFSNEINTVGDSAFNECTSLTTVIMNNNVKIIGANIFNNCTSLTSVTLSNAITSNMVGTFYGCTALASITIPNGITVIYEQAFGNCTSLTNIIIPDSVVTVQDYTFENCTALEGIVFPLNLTIIQNNVCAGCTSLTSVVCGENVTEIEAEAFTNSPITSILIPSDVLMDESTDVGTNTGFRAYYLSQGSVGGTYLYLDGNWTLT